MVSLGFRANGFAAGGGARERLRSASARAVWARCAARPLSGGTSACVTATARRPCVEFRASRVHDAGLTFGANGSRRWRQRDRCGRGSGRPSCLGHAGARAASAPRRSSVPRYRPSRAWFAFAGASSALCLQRVPPRQTDRLGWARLSRPPPRCRPFLRAIANAACLAMICARAIIPSALRGRLLVAGWTTAPPASQRRDLHSSQHDGARRRPPVRSFRWALANGKRARGVRHRISRAPQRRPRRVRVRGFDECSGLEARLA